MLTDDCLERLKVNERMASKLSQVKKFLRLAVHNKPDMFHISYMLTVKSWLNTIRYMLWIILPVQCGLLG